MTRCNDAYLEVSEASPTPFAPPTFLQLENVRTEVRASVLCRWGSTPGATAKAHTYARYLLGHVRVYTILEGGGGPTAVLTGLAGGTVSVANGALLGQHRGQPTFREPV